MTPRARPWSRAPRLVRAAMLGAGGLLGAILGCHAPPPRWRTYDDARSFHFRYPEGWAVTSETSPVQHYRDVLVALNSMGRPGFQIRDLETSSGSIEFSAETTARQLPRGGAYLDIAWWGGPPGWEPEASKEVADPSAILADIARSLTDGPGDKPLLERHVGFQKGGKHWSVDVYLHPPFRPETGEEMQRVLTSIRFDPLPVRPDSR